MFADEPGDTPLRTVPADYDAGGTGRWFVLPEGPDAGRRLYFWERQVTPGDGPVVLLVHGNPECSYTYRHVVASLVARQLPPGTRLVAMDHLGFGRSDQASFEMVDVHHAANLRQLVTALDLRDVTLVVHDWGGPIGIGALLTEPERVRNLVVLNTTVFPVPGDGLTFTNYPLPLLAWSRLPWLVPDALWGQLAATAITTRPAHPVRTLTRAARAYLPLRWDEQIDVFRRQFGSAANARSSKRMVRQTPVWGHGYRYEDPTRGVQDNTAFYREMQAQISRAWGPSGRNIGVAGVFGSWDPLAKQSVLEQWQDALPQLRGNLRVLEHVSHFVEEHEPEPVADAIVALLART